MPRAGGAGSQRSGRRTSSSSTVRAAGTATTTRRGCSTAASASCGACAPRACRRRGSSLPEECLFCRLVRDGEHVAVGEGFVAIRDIDPQAETHLLVLPERHVDSFHSIGEFQAHEAKQMLDFVAQAAASAGLSDYRVVVNAGPGAG